jgi:hypothetical protein
MGNQATSIAAASKKMKHQTQGLFLYANAKYAEYVLSRNHNMQNM